MQLLVTLLLIFCGSMIAVQSVANAAFSRSVGLPLFGIAFTIIQFFVLLPGLALWGRPLQLQALGAQPWTNYIGALVGGIILSAMAFGFSKVSATVAVTAVVLGQMVMGLIFDKTGWLGAQVQPISAERLIGVGMILSGVWLVQR